jgi:4-carboxymuconolactone decarboxylase
MAQLPFDPAKLSPSDRALYERMAQRRRAQGAGFGGPYAALMNHPELCEKIEDLGFYLKFRGHLPREVYQFVVLAVAKSSGAAFEWIDHEAHARAAGVPPAVIDVLREKGIAAGVFPPPYEVVAKVLAATLIWKDVPEAVQDECISAFGVKGFVEIVVLSGFYQMFAAINEGFAISAPASSSRPFA